MNALQFSWGFGALLAPIFVKHVGLVPAALPRTFAILSGASCCMGVWASCLVSPNVCGEDSATEEEVADGGKGEQVAGTPGRRCHFFVAFTALFFYYFCYAGGEMTPGDWLTTASTQSLGVSLEQGVNLTTVFWAALTVGRLAGVPLGLCLTLHALTTLSLALAVVSSGILVVSFQKRWMAGVWASVVGIALGFASLYPAGIIMAQTKFRMGPKWISRCIVGNTIGMMSLPALVGVGIRYSHHVFVWAVVAFIGIQTGCYILLVALKPAAGALRRTDLAKNSSAGSADSAPEAPAARGIDAETPVASTASL